MTVWLSWGDLCSWQDVLKSKLTKLFLWIDLRKGSQLWEEFWYVHYIYLYDRVSSSWGETLCSWQDGKIQWLCSWQDGKIQWLCSWQDGKIQWLCSWQDGKIQWLCSWQDGKIQWLCSWQDGKIQWLCSWQDGKIQWLCSWQDGKIQWLTESISFSSNMTDINVVLRACMKFVYCFIIMVTIM